MGPGASDRVAGTSWHLCGRFLLGVIAKQCEAAPFWYARACESARARGRRSEKEGDGERERLRCSTGANPRIKPGPHPQPPTKAHGGGADLLTVMK